MNGEPFIMTLDIYCLLSVLCCNSSMNCITFGHWYEVIWWGTCRILLWHFVSIRIFNAYIWSHNFFKIFIRHIHDSPTDKGARRIKTAASIEMCHAVASFAVDFKTWLPHALRCMTHITLHCYFDDIQWIEQCTNASTYDGTCNKFLCSLCWHWRLKESTRNKYFLMEYK